jgi:hypothetical protein
VNRILFNVAGSSWAVHFIGPDGWTRIGPWLLLDTHDQVRRIIRWGNATPDEVESHESAIRRWNCSSVVLRLTNEQMRSLIRRGIGWPWNGYELLKMKEAGCYPPKRLPR